jgi:hypothetical protein
MVLADDQDHAMGEVENNGEMQSDAVNVHLLDQ